MTRTLLCLIIFLGNQYLVSAQTFIKIDDYAGLVRDQNLNKKVYDSSQYDGMTGSPYLQDSFLVGMILMRNNEQYSGIPLRYNIYLDEMEFRMKNGDIRALSFPEKIQYIELGGEKLVSRAYLFNKKMQMGFFFVLTEGEMTLFRKSKMSLEKTKNLGVSRNAPPPRFVSRPDEYYLQKKNKAAQHITTKNDLLELFPDKRNELAAFIKKNKVKTNKAEGLIKLVQYYNQ